MSSNNPQEERIKVIYYSEGWGLGGIESYIMLTATNLDPEKFTFDVFCTHDWHNTHDNLLEEYGARRYTVFPNRRPNLLWRTLKGAYEWSRVLQSNDYDVVHINTMNGMGFLYSRIAQKCGVPQRIVHSHNSDFGNSFRIIKKLAHAYGKKMWKKSATTRFSCSDDAGRYLFDEDTFHIIRNCVDTERFQFNPKKRERIRQDLEIDGNALVFGSVGRIVEQKKPIFQVQALRELRNMGVDAHLLLVGSGPLENEVREYAQKQQISDRVHLYEGTASPEDFYSALDIFSMPSSFEGFGITVVEAMTCGCPCLLSKNVPAFNFDLELKEREHNDNPQAWARHIEKMFLKNRTKDRKQGKALIERLGYGHLEAAKQVEPFYTCSK